MGKKDDLTSDLSRGRNIKKKIVASDDEATKVVEKVVNAAQEEKENEANVANDQSNNTATTTTTTQPTTPKTEKKLIRTTIDLPAYIHKAIKVNAAQEGISLKKYLVGLVKKDLGLE